MSLARHNVPPETVQAAAEICNMREIFRQQGNPGRVIRRNRPGHRCQQAANKQGRYYAFHTKTSRFLIGCFVFCSCIFIKYITVPVDFPAVLTVVPDPSCSDGTKQYKGIQAFRKKQQKACDISHRLFVAEKEGFEPSRHFRALLP